MVFIKANLWIFLTIFTVDCFVLVLFAIDCVVVGNKFDSFFTGNLVTCQVSANISPSVCDSALDTKTTESRWYVVISSPGYAANVVFDQTAVAPKVASYQ